MHVRMYVHTYIHTYIHKILGFNFKNKTNRIKRGISKQLLAPTNLDRAHLSINQDMCSPFVFHALWVSYPQSRGGK